jgi:hypothetical protein
MAKNNPPWLLLSFAASAAQKAADFVLEQATEVNVAQTTT